MNEPRDICTRSIDWKNILIPLPQHSMSCFIWLLVWIEVAEQKFFLEIVSIMNPRLLREDDDFSIKTKNSATNYEE
jgi:hypothetical protein